MYSGLHVEFTYRDQYRGWSLRSIQVPIFKRSKIMLLAIIYQVNSFSLPHFTTELYLFDKETISFVDYLSCNKDYKNSIETIASSRGLIVLIIFNFLRYSSFFLFTFIYQFCFIWFIFSGRRARHSHTGNDKRRRRT